MELRVLKYFDDCTRVKIVTRGQQRLNVTQPTFIKTAYADGRS